MHTPRCEAVRRASHIIDDPQRLGELLGVAMEDLGRWLEGRGNPPVPVFLKAVDLIDAHDESLGAGLK